jgi:hypothetical protein
MIEKLEPLKAEISYALPNKNLNNYKVLRSTRVRHPSVKEVDGDIEYSFNYIVVKNGMSSTSVQAPCTKEVFQKVFGRVKTEDSAPIGGFANSTGMQYFIFENKQTKVVEAIVAFPVILQSSRNGKTPSEMEHIRNIEIIIFPSCGFDVDSEHFPDQGKTIFKVPFKTSRQDLEKIISAVMGSDGFNLGDSVGPATVTSIVGTRLVLEI